MHAQGPWTTLEQLVLMHAVIRFSTFIATARAIKQTPFIAAHLSHKRSFFSAKNCTSQYASLVEAHTGTPVSTRGLISDLSTSIEIERDLRKKRITEIQGQIAQANTKIKVIDEDINAIKQVQNENLHELLEKMKKDTQAKEESEDTDNSDSGFNVGYPKNNSPSSDSFSSDTDNSDETPKVSRVPNFGKQPKAAVKYQGNPLQDNLLIVWKLCWDHVDGSVFHYPVSDQVAPGYSTIIKTPIDLSTIKNKLLFEKYKSVQQLKKDLDLMFTNAMVYNQTGSDIYIIAEKMKAYINAEMHFIPVEKVKAPKRILSNPDVQDAPPLKKQKQE